MTADVAVGHYQLVGGRVFVAQYGLQVQLAVVAHVVAMHRQYAGRAVVGGHVDSAGVVERRQLSGGVGADAALGHGQGTAAVDVERAGIAATVTEEKIPGQVQA